MHILAKHQVAYQTISEEHMFTQQKTQSYVPNCETLLAIFRFAVDSEFLEMKYQST